MDFGSTTALRRVITISPSNRYSKRDYYTKPRAQCTAVLYSTIYLGQFLFQIKKSVMECAYVKINGRKVIVKCVERAKKLIVGYTDGYNTNVLMY